MRVFPTSVGMFRRAYPFRRHCNLPHERGDVPQAEKDEMRELWSSPRLWGCSDRLAIRGSAFMVLF